MHQTELNPMLTRSLSKPRHPLCVMSQTDFKFSEQIAVEIMPSCYVSFCSLLHLSSWQISKGNGSVAIKEQTPLFPFTSVLS